jgi:hypothetical protein
MGAMSVSRRVLGAALAGALATGLAACTHSEAASQAPPAADPSAEPATVAVATRVTRVAGDLPASRRRHVATKVGALIADYLEAAYLGDIPGAGLRADFPGFTAGAAKLAEKDRAVLSRAGFRDAERVTSGKAVAYVAVVAAHRRPAGATARISVPLEVVSGGRTDKATVSGRLLLTPTSHGWRIFGYHLASSGAGSAEGAS